MQGYATQRLLKSALLPDGSNLCLWEHLEADDQFSPMRRCYTVEGGDSSGTRITSFNAALQDFYYFQELAKEAADA